MGDFYIKIFEEECELMVMLFIDISCFFFFGIMLQMKNEYIIEICVVLVFLVINNNDKVGVIFFFDWVEKYILLKKGKLYILCIICELFDIEFEGKGIDIGLVLCFFNNVVKKWSICFLFFDFMSQGYELLFWVVVCCYDLIGVYFYDSWEKELFNVGLI